MPIKGLHHMGISKKFKIALLRPPIVQLSTNLSSYGAILPIGLSYVAAVLRQAGHEVTAIDAPGEAPNAFRTKASPVGPLSFQGLTPEELVARIPASTEVIGITHMFLHEWPTVREIAELAKKRFPGITVVLGGENATAFWRRIFTETTAVDYCVLGEGENTVLMLLENLAAGRRDAEMPGIANYRSGLAQNAHLSPRVAQLAEIPRPAWDLFPVENYLSMTDTHGVDRGRSMPILATRGCPFDCTFCSSPQMWTRKYVARDPADVVAEIRDYVEKYKISNINFCDLTAIVRKDWTIKFCDLLERESFHISWQLPTGTRTEALDEEVLRRMYQTGCRNITYAPESGSERMLKVIKKKVNLDALLKSLRSAVKSRLVTRVNIIIGHPREERRDLWASLWFLVKAAWLGCDDAAVMIFAPYPGSEDTENLIRETGLTFGDDYYYLPLARSGWSSRTYNPRMGTKELIVMQYVMLLVFYGMAYLTRPLRIWNAIRTFIKGSGESTQLDQLLRTKFKKRSAAVMSPGAVHD
jgi:radical SAM superfamily enzyme YgiQ (UPF0313 family)